MNEEKIRVESLEASGFSCNINWSNFSITYYPGDFSGICYIYVKRLDGNAERDLRKINRIKEIRNLKAIVISATDFKVAQYFDILLKDCPVIKRFDLLNDHEFKERPEIDFSKLEYDEVSIPFDYMMYISPSQTEVIDSYNIEYQELENDIIKVQSNQQKVYPNMQECINKIIDEIFGSIPMNQLDDIDKTILVSNWIQRYIQFVSGKVTRDKNREYICDNYTENDNVEDIMTVLNKHFGVCNGIAKLSAALLSNPRVGCNCSLVHGPGHAFIVQYIDGGKYITDNTWCITKNPHRMSECIKAMSFSDEYILLGEQEINRDDETAYRHAFDGDISRIGISRERIIQSIEKLKKLGIEFSYGNQPSYIQHEKEIEDNGVR